MREIDMRPKCPKCGLPARWVVGKATVRAQVELDGSPGKIVRSQSFRTDGLLYECGQRHRWNVVSGDVGTALWVEEGDGV
jgi:hypothetical protein